MPGPPVDDCDLHPTIGTAHGYFDRSARRRVNKRVLEQDPHDLEDTLRIAAPWRSGVARVFEWMLRRQCDTRKFIDCCTCDAPEIDRLRLHVQAAGVELRQVEQVVRELRQPPHLTGHRVEELTPRRLVKLFILE